MTYQDFSVCPQSKNYQRITISYLSKAGLSWYKGSTQKFFGLIRQLDSSLQKTEDEQSQAIST